MVGNVILALKSVGVVGNEIQINHTKIASTFPV